MNKYWFPAIPMKFPGSFPRLLFPSQPRWVSELSAKEPAPHSFLCCWHKTRDEGQGRRRTSQIISVPQRTEMFPAHRAVCALGCSHPSLFLQHTIGQPQFIVSLFPAALPQLSGGIYSNGKEMPIRDLYLVPPLLFQSTTGRQKRPREDTEDSTSLLSASTKGALWWALTRGSLRQRSAHAQLNSPNAEL